MDGRTDGWRPVRTDGRTDGQTDEASIDGGVFSLHLGGLLRISIFQSEKMYMTLISVF